jgi:hypothetical protein
MIRRHLLLLAIFIQGACNGRLNVECEVTSSCDLVSGGECVANPPTGNQWCAYPDPACPSGYRFSNFDVGDSVGGKCVEATAATQDAGLFDAPSTAAFEIVYGDDWRIAVDATNDGWFLLVATGADDPDLTTLQVRGVTDTHPVAIVRVTSSSPPGVLGHGHVGGKISVDNMQLYSTAFGEPREFTNQSLLALQLLDAPAGDYSFDAHVDLSVNAIEFALDFKIHHVDSEITYVQPEAVKRRTIFR